MSSTLACAGLPVTDEQQLGALDRIMPEAQLLGRTGRNSVVRWEDPSGARLVLEVGQDGVVDLLPSFRSSTTVLLGDLRAVSQDVAIAALLDEHGEQLTSASLELEQRRLLPLRPVERVRASLTALGVDVAVLPDADAFAASDASLLDPDAPPGDPPPGVPGARLVLAAARGRDIVLVLRRVRGRRGHDRPRPHCWRRAAGGAADRAGDRRGRRRR